ncbi:MAG: hypothetical protein Q8O86_00885 [Dehalococcoidia bacterium]|nr:hypothetical protein [Dehalococcoidia bacterium]
MVAGKTCPWIPLAESPTASVMTEVWRRTFAPLVVKQASGW